MARKDGFAERSECVKNPKCLGDEVHNHRQQAVPGKGMSATYQRDASLPCPSLALSLPACHPAAPGSRLGWSSSSSGPFQLWQMEANCRVCNHSEGPLRLARLSQQRDRR
jgi:hypothetical protein